MVKIEDLVRKVTRQYAYNSVSESEILTIERGLGVKLPPDYRLFLSRMGDGVNGIFTGNDVFYDLLGDIREGADELLEEDGCNFHLDRQDFVFWMHQGYIFEFMRLGGDGRVYSYHEGDMHPRVSFKNFTDWFYNSLRLEGVI